MEAFMNFKKIALGAAMLGLTVMPAMAGIDLTVNVGSDDQAHYDFNAGPSHHHPMIWKAAQKLQAAKHDLWKARDDFHGHKADAIGAINAALDQLRICESR
jgi:hypothetical protein